MVSPKEQNSIYDIKISSISAGFVSGHNAIQVLTAMDLAMKLHYLRFVYYFKSPTFDGFTILKIKETMVSWLNHAYIPCGRLRRADSGQPFIMCNDSGLRIIEAKCHLSLHEWLKSRNESRDKLVVPNHVLGPDLAFSPLVMIQVCLLTDFKCGGKSVGLSWSHVLGDSFSALDFINIWAQVIAGHHQAQPLAKAQQQNHTFGIQSPYSCPSPDPLSTKRVGPVGDLWSITSHSKMETFSFYISPYELTRLQAQIYGENAHEQILMFECICVVIWQYLAKVRGGSGPEVVTICRSDLKTRDKGIITNESQTIGLAKTNIPVREHTPMELGSLLMNNADNERLKIEESMKRDVVLPDFLIYGANLTFVDLSDTSFYEMELRGQKPVYASCFIDNIGDEGVVLVLPTPKVCSGGRVVSVTLLENHVAELKEDWCIA